MHISGLTLGKNLGLDTTSPAVTGHAADEASSGSHRPINTAAQQFLGQLGERVRALRARSGLTRKALAQHAGVSERHLANLEYGVGNVSVLILLNVTRALQCTMAELIGDVTTLDPEWLLIRELLADCDTATLKRVRSQIGEMLGKGGSHGEGTHTRSQRVALIGLRGAGKSTLGSALAQELGYPFLELSREIEQFAGCSVGEIQALYGQAAYRRYERRALEESIQIYQEAVIAMPGGIVSDAANFNLLLTHCNTIWLKAKPEDHMQRVVAQGDMRPMAASTEAMSDLRMILNGRAAFYQKADIHIDTSAQNLDKTAQILLRETKVLLGLN